MTGDWTRDNIPREVCACGCSLIGHRIDLKSKPCNNCDECRAFTLSTLHWREHRTVVEQVAP